MLNNYIQDAKKLFNNYRPIFFHVNNFEDKKKIEALISSNNICIFDELYSQLKELLKCRNPSERYSDEEYEILIKDFLGDCPLQEYGVWVYFPWAAKLVHLLGENEFIELRTSRNKYKITEPEQELLATKTIGIIGLSVGQSIALTLAMERICGHFRLADFDTADLSNLNRLRAGVWNIGIKKAIIAAREILEIDPFLDVEIFDEGINANNIDDFFSKGGKLDILVEVCDSLEMKILSRYKAKEFNIPVVMDTNDRGMIDIERFDIEPSRPILHGLAEGLDPEKITQLSGQERMACVLKIVDADNLSDRMKDSMKEIGRSISTWPQLASSVALGGALTADVCRRILLGQFHRSGRFRVDFEELVGDK